MKANKDSAMWYVEAIMNWQTQETERWEYISEECAKELHLKYYDMFVPSVKSGVMKSCKQ